MLEWKKIMATRKKSVLWITSFFLMAGVAWYLFYNHPLSGGGDMRKSTVFSGGNPAFDFTFEYPIAGWSFNESQGRTEKYDALYLKGSVDEPTRFRTLIEIVVKPLPTTGGPAELLGAFLKRAGSWPKFKVLDQREVELGGGKAFSAVYESEARLPMEDLNAKPVMIKEQSLFLVRKDKLYRFSLHSLAEQWEDPAAAFEQVLGTFKFKD